VVLATEAGTIGVCCDGTDESREMTGPFSLKGSTQGVGFLVRERSAGENSLSVRIT